MNTVELHGLLSLLESLRGTVRLWPDLERREARKAIEAVEGVVYQALEDQE